MHSFFSIMEGETTSCVGCHEHRTRAPREKYDFSTLQAVNRAPDTITPVPGTPQIFDYMRDIQPIWDKHCVKCHNMEKYAGQLALISDLNPAYNVSYSNLVRKRGMLDIGSSGNRPAYDGGTADSQLYEVLAEGHKNVKLSEQEMRMIRTWIDASATFAGSYAAIGDASRDNRVPKDLDYSVIEETCHECHGYKGKWLKGREMRREAYYFNTTRPEKSLLLLAPLTKEAGGLGLCMRKIEGSREKEPAKVFASKGDPKYEELRKFTLEVVDRYDDRKRWFQEGYVPRDFYIREMKRFGALPEDFDPETDEMDPWETDKRYFEIINEAAIGEWE
jgi:cytochrome c553